MKPAHILAIDQGTTNTKALMVNREGTVVAAASQPVPIRFPQPAWVEQDAEALWQSVQVAAGAALDAAGTAPAAIAITNQRESVIVWDRRTGVPLGPCVVWQCRRTTSFCSALRARGVDGLLRARTGLGIDPLFSASKARWLLDQIPDGTRRAESGDIRIGTVDSWLLWKLTGGAVHASDRTNASRTQLMDLRRLAWDDELLSLFGIPAAALPRICPSSHVYGHTAACGRIPAGVPVASLIGDSHAALFGHAMFTPGAVKATYGTGSSLMAMTAEPVVSNAGLSTTVAWSRGDETKYAMEGNIPVTGAAVEWLADFLSLKGGAAAVAALARTVPDSGGVHLVPAFVGLGAPYWNDGVRGLVAGLTRGSTAAHAARAAVESIGFQVRDVFVAMERDLGRELPELLADGGASCNDDVMQFQADILGRTVKRSVSHDLSAMGAAWLAGLATGVWGSLEELDALARSEHRFEPRMSNAERERRCDAWRDAVERAVLPVREGN